ncbi:MAG TPA: hypothetical protein VK427_02600, partial [Kofleriaceae bacterium]|nr:hypothetical protein [Kofleriaceae bacterium]
DEVLQAHYLAARAWWTPVDAPPPAASELVGPIRCRYVSCKPADLVRDAVRSDAIDALLLAPPVRTGDPEAAAAWLAITLAQALRREGDWATLFAARVNVDSLAVDRLPPWARDAYAIVTARRGDGARESGADLPLAGHLLAAAVAVHRGRSPAEVRALLGSLAETPEGNALLAIATPPPTSTAAQNRRATALARYIAARRATAVADVVELERADAMLRAYRRDPLVADRIADEIVASHVDAAVGHAWVATAFGVVRDPARARARWQAAVDLSPAEPALSRGLAEAIARANDPDAALVAATHAAAASGDPGPVWIAISNALHGVGADVHALEAARYAIDLASTEHAAAAFEAAIAASEALGRRAQAAALRTRRANVAPPVLTASMLAESHDDAWRATRWHPRDVASRAALLAALPENDVRRGILADELVVLAGDADPARGLAAFDALAELAELDH